MILAIAAWLAIATAWTPAFALVGDLAVDVAFSRHDQPHLGDAQRRLRRRHSGRSRHGRRWPRQARGRCQSVFINRNPLYVGGTGWGADREALWIEGRLRLDSLGLVGRRQLCPLDFMCFPEST